MPAEPPDPARQALAAARERARRQGRRLPAARSPRPEGYSGAAPDERDPQLLGSQIDRLIGECGWSDTVPVATIMGAWDRIAGPEVAAHCRPERLIDGELSLVAESTAWATQLRLLSAAVLARVTEAVGPDVVRRIRVTGPASPDWRHGPRRVRGPGPRDTYG